MHGPITRTKLWLPVFGVAIAVILNMIGRYQAPTVVQDFPPAVAPAISLCASINAPATLLLGTAFLVAHSIHAEEGFSRALIPHLLFYGGVALLWLFVGFEIDLRRTNVPSPKHRVIVASAAITVATALASFGFPAWRQGYIALTMGNAIWSAALSLFYIADVIRLAVSLSKRDRDSANC